MWKRGEIAPKEQFTLGAISPLFHIILLPVVMVSCFKSSQVLLFSQSQVQHDIRGNENTKLQLGRLP